MNPRDTLLDEINNFLTLLSPLGNDFSFDVFTNIYNAFVNYIKRLHDFVFSNKWPNVNYSFDYDKRLYYTSPGLSGGILWFSIPNQPNVIYKNGLLQYTTGHDVWSNVHAKRIKNNVYYKGSNLWANGNIFIPDGLVRLNTKKPYSPIQYWDKTKFVELDIIDEGALRIFGKQVLKYGLDTETGKRVWQGFDIPRRIDDIWTGSIMPQWDGNIRAKSDNSGLEVYRSGAWVDLFTF